MTNKNVKNTYRRKTKSLKKRDYVIPFLGIVMPAFVAIAMHILNPLIVNKIGQLGPFTTKQQYIPSRSLTYYQGCEMIREAAKTEQSHIINIRNTCANPEQPAFFNEISEALETSRILYTRAIYYKTDLDLSNTRWFLYALGENPNFRLKLSVFGEEFPSCVITDKSAIFGFNDNSGVLTRGLYISGPQNLVDDFRETARRIIENPISSITVKDFGETIKRNNVDSIIFETERKLQIYLDAIKNLKQD